MSSGGGSKVEYVPTQSTTKTEPWEGQQPYLTTGFERAKTDVLNRPTSYYPGETVVPFSPQTEQALQMQEQRALAGSPLTGASQTSALNTMSGQYLPQQAQDASLSQLSQTLGGDFLTAGNPYFSAMADRMESTIRPKVQSAFESAGRSNSAGVQEAYSRAMADAMAPLAYQNYSDERQRQMQASGLTGQMYDAERARMLQSAGMSPQLAATDYADIGQLLGAGTTREALQREQVADDMARYNYSQMEPSNRLAQYMGLIQGNYGGTSFSQGSQPYYQQSSNPLLMGLGGLAGLGSLGLFGGFGGF